MPQAPKTFRPPQSRSRTEVERLFDARRGSARERGYDRRWEKVRATYLAAHPLCAYCALDDRIEPATIVDHLWPHRVYGGFWDEANWVATCAPCHDGPKQATERAGPAALATLSARLGRPPRPLQK